MSTQTMQQTIANYFKTLDLHRDELMENWERLSNSEAAKKIDPLK